MNSNETKIKSIARHLQERIEHFRAIVSSAVREMDRFSISPDEYRKEGSRLLRASYTLGFLNLVSEVAKTGNVKNTENYIRFLLHQIKTKSSPDCDEVLSAAQCNTADVLEEIISKFLD